jgi:GT2 family glycosyltransferase
MDLSVVIPTRDRSARLRRTLRVLQEQRLDGIDGEIIVVENGSDRTDPPDVNGPLEVKTVWENSTGVSAARNRGLESAASDLVLLLGDDTPPAAADLLTCHVELHRRRPEPTYAVLGRIDWDPGGEVTPFMEWLSRAGFQNAYHGLKAGPVSAVHHFFTSHVSAKRPLLLEVGGFDESFPFFFEHVELGIRLQQAGVMLDYHPELLVHHDHRQTLAGFVRRMEEVGSAARALRERWPDRTPPEVTAPSARWHLYPAADLVARALLRAGVRGRIRERAWGVRLMAAYARGYRAPTGVGISTRASP